MAAQHAVFHSLGVARIDELTALAATLALSVVFRARLGLYGRLMDSPIGLVGLVLVLFWVFTALFAPLIVTHDALAQVSGMKNAVPGTLLPDPDGRYPAYLLGGDALARDVFSRVVLGAREVLKIAPAAALVDEFGVQVCGVETDGLVCGVVEFEILEGDVAGVVACQGFQERETMFFCFRQCRV